jgi:MFS family permease
MTKPKLSTSSRLRMVFGAGALALAALLAFPATAFAHGDTNPPAAAAGPIAAGFLIFGTLVIAGVFTVLLSGKTATGDRAAEFAEAKGFQGYLQKIRLFSRNARLYVVHIVGMDVIFGTWQVIFNLYLLAVGFDVAFIGLRILVSSAATALISIPAGLISDRIGRKASFILGDGLGAVMSLIAISTAEPAILLITAALGGAFGALHGVAEPAFMAENSERFERVHLFSVSAGTRTAAAIIGSALAGLIPLVILGDVADAAKVGVFRSVAYAGIGGWFASLIPAILLRQTTIPKSSGRGAAGPAAFSGGLFRNLRNPGRIWRLTLPEVLVGFGAGFALPLMNVFFHTGLDSPEIEIGATFAAGEAFLVVGAFLAPAVAARLGKVNAVALTRLASIPFILMIALSADIGSAFGSVLTIAGLAYVARITLMNMASPVRSAFSMEILDPGERGTQVGIQQALVAGLSGLASFYGARMMGSGDFRTPFFLMAAFYFVSTLMFWQFFNGREAGMAESVGTVVDTR